MSYTRCTGTKKKKPFQSKCFENQESKKISMLRYGSFCTSTLIRKWFNIDMQLHPLNSHTLQGQLISRRRPAWSPNPLKTLNGSYLTSIWVLAMCLEFNVRCMSGTSRIHGFCAGMNVELLPVRNPFRMSKYQHLACLLLKETKDILEDFFTNADISSLQWGHYKGFILQSLSQNPLCNAVRKGLCRDFEGDWTSHVALAFLEKCDLDSIKLFTAPAFHSATIPTRFGGHKDREAFPRKLCRQVCKDTNGGAAETRDLLQPLPQIRVPICPASCILLNCCIRFWRDWEVSASPETYALHWMTLCNLGTKQLLITFIDKQ